MQTSFCLAEYGYSQHSNAFSSWWLCKSGHRQTRQYITCGSPLRCETCRRPSSERGNVTHLLGAPGLLSARSSSSSAPFCFFSFLTSESTAFSAHFSSSSPCFQPRSRLTAGLVNEKRLLRLLMIGDDMAMVEHVLCKKDNKWSNVYCLRARITNNQIEIDLKYCVLSVSVQF